MSELRVETCVLGAEVGNAKGGADASAGEKDYVGRLLEQLNYVLDGVVLREFDTLTELAGDSKGEKRNVGGVWSTFEKGRRADTEGGAELLGSDGVIVESREYEGVCAKRTKQFSVGESFVK